MSHVPAAIAQLSTVMPTYDTTILEWPGKPYAIVTADAGVARPERYTAESRHVREVIRVMLVARTLDGLRAAVTLARDTLTDHKLTPDCSPLVEQFATDSKTSGPVNDVRHDMTITYAHTYPRSTP